MSIIFKYLNLKKGRVLKKRLLKNRTASFSNQMQIYAGIIASVGQAAAHAPQSVHVSGSIV